MARVHQELTIWKQKGANLSNANYIIVTKKTGYQNLWINGQHYYYDKRTNPSMIDNSVLLIAFNGGNNQQKKKKKGKITVTKKKGK